MGPLFREDGMGILDPTNTLGPAYEMPNFVCVRLPEEGKMGM